MELLHSIEGEIDLYFENSANYSFYIPLSDKIDFLIRHVESQQMKSQYFSQQITSAEDELKFRRLALRSLVEQHQELLLNVQVKQLELETLQDRLRSRKVTDVLHQIYAVNEETLDWLQSAHIHAQMKVSKKPLQLLDQTQGNAKTMRMIEDMGAKQA